MGLPFTTIIGSLQHDVNLPDCFAERAAKPISQPFCCRELSS
jgi:hypothetical protein